MADATTRPARTRRWRGRIAVVLFSLFPMLVMGGLLAPGVVL
jgi:hypothetical protein